MNVVMQGPNTVVEKAMQHKLEVVFKVSITHKKVLCSNNYISDAADPRGAVDAGLGTFLFMVSYSCNTRKMFDCNRLSGA